MNWTEPRESETPTTRALLILYPDEHAAEEAASLAKAAGYEPVARLTQRYLSRSKFGVGEGKAEEAARVVREKDAKVIIFDSKLNASQTYNLAKLCKVEVKDREKLILEIFAKRASTAEAKLQVELAELNYELPRARDMVRKAKAGEQPGIFGLGKYDVDVYVRMIRRRVATVREKVEEVRGRRKVYRRHRLQEGFSSVAITGYTGAGKTTLFNRLTGETKEVNRGAFTTLTPTTRKIVIDNEGVLVSDTVGFIARLPTYLIEAFKSTLEEVSYSTLVLVLVDASQPAETMAANYDTCIRTLADLGVAERRILVAMNKTDLVGHDELLEKAHNIGVPDPVEVSARTGRGVDELLGRMSSRLAVGRADKEYGVIQDANRA